MGTDRHGAVPKLKKLVADEGVFFTNGFIATPICCPSRSTYISGQFQHNHRCLQNSVSAGCNSLGWQAGPELLNPALALKKVGYTTMYAGKYLNAYGFNNTGTPPLTGVKHVPPGWDNWLGLVGNSRYYDWQISRNGVVEAHGHDYATDYFTDFIKNETLLWLRANLGKGKPVLAWSATPACHGPNDAAPQYQGLFADEKAPRTANFNTGMPGKNRFNSPEFHPAMNASEIEFSDLVHRRRLQVLQSVDDLVEAYVNELTAADALEDTVLLYTSDHGYHMGQFAMVYDKRTPYEHDVRIPYMVRLPKNLVSKEAMARLIGTESTSVVSNVDVAPSLAALVGKLLLFRAVFR